MKIIEQGIPEPQSAETQKILSESENNVSDTIGMPIRIGIVGPEEWKLGNRAVAAYNTCGSILSNAKSGIMVKSVDKTGIFAADFQYMDYHSEVILVSGRCPVSVCEGCGKRSFLPPDYPVDGSTYTECEFCGEKKKRRAGGIDIYAEMNASERGCKTEICPPGVNEWKDKNGKAGFKSRNIKIAETSDILFVVVPKASTICKHCGSNRPAHISNGGCWTGVYAETLHKRVVWVIL
ncbi:MAG: hypothetical protein JRN68_03300 [Nitrososphaerota archaeon]|nr:hypothetical protein [Nitrososphaerota archaeon]